MEIKKVVQKCAKRPWKLDNLCSLKCVVAYIAVSCRFPGSFNCVRPIEDNEDTVKACPGSEDFKLPKKDFMMNQPKTELRTKELNLK